VVLSTAFLLVSCYNLFGVNMIKKDLKEHIGKEAMIKYSLGRNKYESYHVRVKELYEYIFLVECFEFAKY